MQEERRQAPRLSQASPLVLKLEAKRRPQSPASLPFTNCEKRLEGYILHTEEIVKEIQQVCFSLFLLFPLYKLNGSICKGICCESCS